MSTPASTPRAVLSTDTSAVRRLRPLALGLTSVSGYLDAFVFLRVARVFVSNQSGNLVLEGIALGERRWEEALLPLVSVLAYVLGAALAVGLLDRDDGGRRRVLGVLVVQIVALVCLCTAMAITHTGWRPGPLTVLQVALIAAASMTMGAQATAVRNVEGLPVLTTAGTGAATSVGVALGRLGVPALRRSIAVVGTTVGGTVVAYVAGASLGALLCTITGIGPALLLVPIPLLVVLLAVVLTPPPAASPDRR